MSAKNKIASSLITFFSLILLLIFAATLPMTMQYVQNNALAKTYNAYGVAATVSGKYYVGDNSYKMFSGENENIHFNADDEQSSPALDISDSISLSSKNDYTILEYKFINNSNEVSFVTRLTNIIEVQNMDVTYGYSYQKLTTYENINLPSLDSVPLIYGKGNVLYLYIKIKVANLNKASALSGSFCFDLIANEVYELYLIDGRFNNKTYVALGYKVNSIEVPVVEGMKFEGYFTSPNGKGKQVFNENGESEMIWAQADGDVLYAHYSIKN